MFMRTFVQYFIHDRTFIRILHIYIYMYEKNVYILWYGQYYNIISVSRTHRGDVLLLALVFIVRVPFFII